MAICRERACIFPAIPGSEYCRDHQLAFEFDESMTDGNLDLGDFLSTDGEALLSTHFRGMSVADYEIRQQADKCVFCLKRPRVRRGMFCVCCRKERDLESARAHRRRNAAHSVLYRKQRYERLKLLGLCTKCAGRPIESGWLCAECLARARAYDRRRYLCNRSAVLRKRKAYREQNREKIAAYQHSWHERKGRDYYNRNREKYRAKNQVQYQKRREEKMQNKYGRRVTLRFGDIRVRGTEFTIAQFRRFVKKEKAAR